MSGTGRLGALLGALVLIATLAYTLNAGAFTVRRLEVSGASALSKDDLAAAGGVMGHNVFTVDPQSVAERLAALPRVREAQVWAELPDRLVVQVVERQGALVWQAGGERFLVDPDGVVIAPDPPDEQAGGLVTVQARDADLPQVGGRVDPATARTAVAVARWLAQGSPAPVAGLEYAPRTGLVLVGRDGWRVVLGSDARIEEKLAVTLALLKGERTWKTLDVTDPDRPFYK